MKACILFSGQQIVVNPDCAKLFGLVESIILQQVHFWVWANGHPFDGHKWIYNSYTEWSKQLPFLSVGQVRTAIHSLEEKNVLISGNFNRLKIDRTKWYRVNYAEVERLAPEFLNPDAPQVGENPNVFPSAEFSRSLANGSQPHANSRLALPEITSEITSEKKTPIVPKGTDDASQPNLLETESIIETLYKAYPRKVGKAAAVRAIEKALKKMCGADLMARVERFASHWKPDDDLQYCPHPSTWFNQERFNDDPATWRRPENKNASYARLRDKERLLREQVTKGDDDFKYPEDRKADPLGYVAYQDAKKQLEAVKKEMLRS